MSQAPRPRGLSRADAAEAKQKVLTEAMEEAMEVSEFHVCIAKLSPRATGVFA